MGVPSSIKSPVLFTSTVRPPISALPMRARRVSARPVSPGETESCALVALVESMFAFRAIFSSVRARDSHQMMSIVSRKEMMSVMVAVTPS